MTRQLGKSLITCLTLCIGLTSMIPLAARADVPHRHRVCHYNAHHHRVCHWSH